VTIQNQLTLMVRTAAFPGRRTSVVIALTVAAALSGGTAPAAAQAKTKVNAHDGLTYILVPAGTFDMGCSPGDMDCKPDERPVHSVTISKDFWIGETAVTQAAYQKVMKANPSLHKGEQLPVTFINWAQADAYCKAIEMRLPTEAEYEYAARGGSPTSHYGEPNDIAWSYVTGVTQAHPVKQKQPNKYGLYDMLGNVWVWMSDWYGPYSADKAVDPTGPATGRERAERGGSWFNGPRTVRVSSRDFHLPEYRYTDVSVRCAGN
jgi:formylglycine-generating enzyme required for sulfatase activity